MKVRTITPHILHVTFPTQRELAATFLRFEEHYESPKFRGRRFTLAEFKRWYAKEHGAFTYYKDWPAFNIPSSVLEPFYKGRFDPLSRREKRFLDAFRNLTGRFYIIGTTEKAKEGFVMHETAHGLYYTDPSYRGKVLRILRKTDLSGIRKFLHCHGYHPAVHWDESHAYLLTDMPEMRRSGVKLAPLRDAHKKLHALYKKHTQPYK